MTTRPSRVQFLNARREFPDVADLTKQHKYSELEGRTMQNDKPSNVFPFYCWPKTKDYNAINGFKDKAQFQ